jgi:hypothetical protein
MENETEKTMTINCDLACLLNDSEGVLDSYAKVTINCDAFIASSQVYAKLSGKNTRINADSLRIKEIKGRLLQLEDNTVIDGGMDFKDLVVLAAGNLIATTEGLRALGEAEGVMVLNTFYYPRSGDLGALTKIDGKKQAYNGGAWVLLEDQTLEQALTALPAGGTGLWINGTLTALDAKALEAAKSAGITVECKSLLTYEGLYAAYGSLFTSQERTLVPDGYEILGNLDSAELPLHGPRIYVNGDFTMDEKDLPLLEALEGIVVRGRAQLPVSAVQTFKTKGRAAAYNIFEGRLVELNGNVHWGKHFAGNPRERLTVRVNGRLRFDDDVTAEDLECIAAFSYNGVVLLPPEARAALAPRIRDANGFMGTPAEFEETIPGSIPDTGEEAAFVINGDSFILV